MGEYQLTAGIITLSVANNWDEAKREWTLAGVHFADEPETCLCGKFPIIEICTLRNSKNGKLADVGNECVKKFLGLPSDTIFQGVKRVRKDISNALNFDAVLHAFKQGWMNEWERVFYVDTMRKRKLTHTQLSKREEINERVLKNMQRAKK